MALAADTRAAAVASLLRMMRTRTLSAVLVWLRASERISVRVLGIWNSRSPSQPGAASRESGGASNFHAGQLSRAPSGQVGPDAREWPTSISDQTKWPTKAPSIAA